MRSRSWSPPLIGLAILCAFLVMPSVRAADPGARIDLGVQGRTNATPSIAADGDGVAVSWGASLQSGATDVFLAMSRDGARTFGAPVRVNDVDGDARLNGEQPPRVTLSRDTVTVVWTTKGANGTTLVQSRSTDGGRTFAKAVVVRGSDAPGNRGWENVTVARSAKALAERTFVVWLDHRELAKQDGDVAASHHDHAAMVAGKTANPDSVAMAQKSKLYIASLDGAAAPRAITGGVCYCCKTAIVAGPDGSIYAAWRHVYPGNIRDIAFTMSRDGGGTFAAPVRVSEDNWVLEGCPDDGPAMALDTTGRIHIVWPTLVTGATAGDGETAEQKDSPRSPRTPRLNVDSDTIALFYATSADGKRFTPRERIATQGMPHHPQIAIGSDGTPVLAWDEAAKGTRRAVIARRIVDARGPARFTREILDEGAIYPVVAAVRGATVAAWTSGRSASSMIRVERKP